MNEDWFTKTGTSKLRGGSAESNGWIEAFFPGISLGEFRRSFWPRVRMVGRADLKQLAGIFSIGSLQELSSVLAVVPDRITVWCAGKSYSVDRAQAGKCFEAGYTIYVDKVDRYIPELRPILRSIERELHLSYGCGFCNIFASKRGSGAASHFDYDFGFNLLLQGRKVWKFAENRVRVNPMVSYAGSPTSSVQALEGKADSGDAFEATAKWEVIEVREGHVVFVPRGVWHETEAKEDCLAVDFSFAPKTWVTLFLQEIESELSAREDWRESVLDVRGVPGDKSLVGRVGERIESLKQAIASMPHQELAEKLVGYPLALSERALYSRKRGASIELQTSSPSPGMCEVILRAGARCSRVLRAPQEAESLFFWLSIQEGVFSGRRVADACPFVEVECLTRSLAALVENDVLERAGV